MSRPPGQTVDESAAGARDMPARGPRPATRTLVRFTSLSVIGALLFIFHGISLHLTPWSQAIINGIVKFGYGTAGQEDTTVVLFREENLRDLNESYPVSYERHAEVLEALSIHQPRAVFVDFAFVDRRRPEDVERLSQALCALKETGAAVYLARPAPGADPRFGQIDRALLRCATLVSAQMDSEQGVSGVLTYSNGVHTPAGFVPTPAFAMAAPDLALSPRDEQPMEIIWGNGVAPLNRKWMNCEADGALSHLVQVLRHQPTSAKLRCPYTRTISVGHLLGSSGDPDVQQALRKRAVFYGAAFQMTGDRVLSPVFYELPGVYLHAMAYDNLVTFGHDFKRAHRELVATAGRRIVIPVAGLIDGLLLLATVAILLLVEEPSAVTRQLQGRLGASHSWLRWGALGIAAVLVAVAAAVPTMLSSVFLGLPLLLGVFALLHLATPTEGRAGATQGFVGRHVVTLGLAVAAVSLFLVVDRALGLEAALLLVVLPGYFLYKVLVAKDVLFVGTAALLVLSSLISSLPPINLGPRNVIAYVAFFEVARHLIHRADKAAAEYFRLRREHGRANEWGLSPRLLKGLDWIFAVCARAEEKEVRHGKPATAVA